MRVSNRPVIVATFLQKSVPANRCHEAYFHFVNQYSCQRLVALTAIRHLKGEEVRAKGNSRTVDYDPPFLLSGTQNSRAFAEIAVVLDRGNANAHYRYGVALLHENKPYLALGELKEAIEINPGHVEAKRAAVSAISAVEGSLSEDKKRLTKDDEYKPPVLSDIPSSGANDIQRTRMTDQKTIEYFARDKGLTVAELEEAADNWKTRNIKITACKNTLRRQDATG